MRYFAESPNLKIVPIANSNSFWTAHVHLNKQVPVLTFFILNLSLPCQKEAGQKAPCPAHAFRFCLFWVHNSFCQRLSVREVVCLLRDNVLNFFYVENGLCRNLLLQILYPFDVSRGVDARDPIWFGLLRFSPTFIERSVLLHFFN